jgi:hypothetical protein
MRSIAICIFSERFQLSKKKYRPPNEQPKIAHHQATKNSDSAMTASVGAGRSAPKDLKTSLKAGMTKIMITVSTTKATTSTAIGYISADLIFDLMAIVFSW